MKPLSKTLKENGIAFTLPITIRDTNGNATYHENSDGYWSKSQYDGNGNETYYETSNGFWSKSQYDGNGNITYYEDSEGFWSKSQYDDNGNETYYANSDGTKAGTPKSKTCAGKVVEVDGIKYKLTPTEI